MKVNVKCTYCSILFKREISLYNQAIKRGYKQFCSRKCRDKFNSTLISKQCTHCDKPIKIRALLYKRSKSKHFFCSHSCSASFSNKKRMRIKYGKRNKCTLCGNLTRNRIYCSKKCESIHRKEKFEKKKEIIRSLGYIELSNSEECNRRLAKRFLIEEYEHKCWICKRKKWLGKSIPLVIDHIDGDATNNKLKNLRLVCGNCNMLLPTFAGGNRGKGKRSKKPRI